MPKPPGLYGEEYWEFYRNRWALHQHGAGDTTSTNSRYTKKSRKKIFSEPPKKQVDPSGVEDNINPPIKKKEDHSSVVKKNNVPIRIDNDPYDDSSDEDLRTPEESDSSTSSEDEGQGSNEVQGPVHKEPNDDSHEDGETSEPKAKKKLLF
jgi:hypothetical protein